MPAGRLRIRALIAALSTALVALTLGAVHLAPASANPEPDSSSDAPSEEEVESAEAKAKRLYHEAEVASEAYNETDEALRKSKLRLKTLGRDLDRQSQKVATMRTQVASIVVNQYQGQALSTASQVLFSPDPDSFLDSLSAVTSYNSQRGEMMNEYSVELDRLELRRQAVQEETAALGKLEKSMKAKKAEIDERAAAADAVLKEMKEEQLAAFIATSSASEKPKEVPASLAGSGRAGVAVKWAMSQVGKSYVFGAMGPNAFDCSGLTMRAWGAAGVGLSHSSRMQINEGQRVSRSELRPGDLVFYYSPISHVGMYIGNGQIVNAQNPSSGVKVTGLDSMPYVGAVRPG